jgi:UDP-GlcNAc:undecaprenyl-phosphate GlcNAc-1-phosphate transferase
MRRPYMVFEPWTILLATAGISAVLCVLLTPMAKRTGLLDHPSDRKIHKSPTPLVGGLAIYVTFILAIFLATPYASQTLPLLAACGLMLITGMLDDVKDLSAKTRFIVEIAAVCIMIFASGIVLTDFGSLMWNGVLSLGWLSIPITIFAALGVINAFNMMDGIDGLSAMIFIIAGTAMALLALSAGQVFNASLLIITIGAALGFFILNARLPWNKKARVFLGDSGSAMLGLFLAWQFVDLGNGDDRAFAPITAVWILAVPLVDTIRVMIHRWRIGASSMVADQLHLHHAFLKAGFSVNQTLIGIGILVLTTTAIGIIGHLQAWPEYLMFYGYMAFGVCYLYIMRVCWKHGRFLGRKVATELI